MSRLVISLLGLFLLVPAGLVRGDSSAASVYVGVGFTGNGFIGGDLDGEGYYSGGTDFVILVPRPQFFGPGWSVNAGYRGSGGMGLELGISQSYHSSTWTDIEGVFLPGDENVVDTTLASSVVFVDFTQEFTNRRVRPIIRGGLGASFSSAREGTQTVSGAGYGAFSGISLRAGAGIQMEIFENLRIGLDLLYQLDMYTEAAWSGENARIDPRMYEHLVRAVIGVTYHYRLNW